MTISPGPHKRGLVHHDENPDARLRLFCLPYAGGGAAIFRSWSDHLPSSVEVLPIELPGRGRRVHEAPFKSITEMVNSVTRFVAARSDKPFALFGHSMGSIIGFEVARKLRRENLRQPARLFASGRRAPQVNESTPPTHNLSKEEFLEVLQQLNGSAPEALQNAELMELMLPTIRADFKAIETYTYSHEPPLDCSITAFGGLQDHHVGREPVECWKTQTNSSFRLHWIPGDHFFLNTHRQQLLDVLAQELEELVDTVLPQQLDSHLDRVSTRSGSDLVEPWSPKSLRQIAY